jgi:hypothetical protein
MNSGQDPLDEAKFTTALGLRNCLRQLAEEAQQAGYTICALHLRIAVEELEEALARGRAPRSATPVGVEPQSPARDRS